MQSGNSAEIDIGLLAAAGGEDDGGCRRLLRGGVEVGYGVGHVEGSAGIGLRPLMESRVMQRVPWLCHHCQKILAGREIAKVVSAGVVRCSLGILCDSGTGIMAVGLEKEQYLGVLHRIAAIAGHYAVQRGDGRHPQDKAFCLLALAGHYGGVEQLMLIVQGEEKAAPEGNQIVLGRGEALQRELAVAAGLNRGDGLLIRRGNRSDRGPPYRLSGGCVHHCSGDAVEGRGRWSRLRSGRCQQQRHDAENHWKETIYHCAGTSRTRLLVVPGERVTACPGVGRAASAARLWYSRTTGAAKV